MKIGILEDHAIIAELLKENLNLKLGYDKIYILFSYYGIYLNFLCSNKGFNISSR